MILESIKSDIMNYSSPNASIYYDFSIEELKYAFRNVVNGIGLYGISPIVYNLFPQSLSQIILEYEYYIQ